MTISRFPLDDLVDLQVRIGFGSVLVEAVDDLTEATVEVSGREDENLVVELSAGTLIVRAPRQGGLPSFFGRPGSQGRREAHDVQVRVPAGTPVQVMTFTAPIRVRGRCGNADLAFGSSDATLEQVDGDLRLRFGNGSARAVEVSGDVEVRSGNGHVELGDVGGRVNSGTGNGNLAVRVT